MATRAKRIQKKFWEKWGKNIYVCSDQWHAGRNKWANGRLEISQSGGPVRVLLQGWRVSPDPGRLDGFLSGEIKVSRASTGPAV